VIIEESTGGEVISTDEFDMRLIDTEVGLMLSELFVIITHTGLILSLDVDSASKG
jgi:hypothetical protein